MESRQEIELEETVELLRQQLKDLTGSSKEIGALVALRYGMTDRLATMLFMLVNRAPAVISRNTFHIIMYGDRSDGGPEPKIFAVHISKLRAILRRLKCPGKIETVWGAGYYANPALVKWVKEKYEEK